MLSEIISAFSLLAACVVIHTSGLAWLIRRQLTRIELTRGMRSLSWLLIKIASALVILHLLQIALWALFFHWNGCLPDLESAFYFSGTTYSTVGYGDVVLPQGWRLLGPMEGLTGILMCGLSTGFFFLAASRIFQMVNLSEAHGSGGREK